MHLVTCSVQHPASGGGSTALYFVSASMDGTVRLWMGQSWACLRIFTAAAVHAPMPFLAAALSSRCVFAYTATACPKKGRPAIADAAANHFSR